MTFHKPTTGKQRMADDTEPQGSPVGGFVECSPVSTPPAHEAGHDRRAGGSKPPHVGEKWRHRRTGITAEVIYCFADGGLYTDCGPTFWPEDTFLQSWERV